MYHGNGTEQLRSGVDQNRTVTMELCVAELKSTLELCVAELKSTLELCVAELKSTLCRRIALREYLIQHAGTVLLKLDI